MALGVGTVWEIRTTGSATNGGGFNPLNASTAKIPYTEQDLAQLSLTDLASTATTNILTSVTGGFTEAMEGNLIYISEGTNFTPGFYEIVDLGGDDHTVTLDRDPTTGGNGSDGHGNVGGAQSSPRLVCAKIPAASALGANKVWIKAGEYIITTSTVTVTQAGTRSKYHTITGYNTTRGDATAPCVTWNADNGSFHVYTGGANFITLEYIIATGRSTGTPQNFHGFFVNFTPTDNLFYRCRATNVGNSGFLLNGGSATTIGCEADTWGVVTSTASGFYMAGGQTEAIGCYAHNGTGYGFRFAEFGANATNCIADTCTLDGFANASASEVVVKTVNCVAYACRNGIYSSVAGTNNYIILVNFIASANTTYGISTNASSGTGVVNLMGCAFFNNSSGEISTNTTVIETIPRVSLGTAAGNDPFTNAAGGDFTLRSSAKQVLGTGWPGHFLSNGQLTSWSSSPDFGAVQKKYKAGPFVRGGLCT